MNFRGSHDQAQDQAEGCDPFNRPKDRQARVTQAIGACIVQISRGTRYWRSPRPNSRDLRIGGNEKRSWKKRRSQWTNLATTSRWPLYAVGVHLRTRRDARNGSGGQKCGTSSRTMQLVLPLKKELRTAQVTSRSRNR